MIEEISTQDEQDAFEATVLQFQRASSSIEGNTELNKSQINQLLDLLERGWLKPQAFIGLSTFEFTTLLCTHAILVRDCVLVDTIECDKPVYLCTVMNGVSKFTLKNRELLIDDNTEVDLQMSYFDALQLQLKAHPSVRMRVGPKKSVLLTRMVPEVQVDLSVRGADGQVKTLSTILSVYVKEEEVGAEEDAYSDSHSSSNKRRVAVVESERKRQRQERTSLPTDTATETTEATEATYVNSLAPVKHSVAGFALLGKSGADKLHVKFDALSNEIVVLPPHQPSIGFSSFFWGRPDREQKRGLPSKDNK